MNGLASDRVIVESAMPIGAATDAVRVRNPRRTMVNVVEPTGTRGVRVTSGQRLMNQFDVTA